VPIWRVSAFTILAPFYASLIRHRGSVNYGNMEIRKYFRTCVGTLDAKPDTRNYKSNFYFIHGLFNDAFIVSKSVQRRWEWRGSKRSWHNVRHCAVFTRTYLTSTSNNHENLVRRPRFKPSTLRMHAKRVITECAAVTVTLCTQITELFGSNLGWATGHHDRFSVVFFSRSG
jgi:hypothetical protein